jgi:stringent starvation protein B
VTESIPTTKPYLLRAIFEWAEDNNFTPQVLVNATVDGVDVPSSYVVDGQIVLNISSTATQLHQMDNEAVSFSARFSGKSHTIYLPMASILAIFARENSQGIFFEEIDLPDPSPTDGDPKQDQKQAPSSKVDKSKGSGSHLKIVK